MGLDFSKAAQGNNESQTIIPTSSSVANTSTEIQEVKNYDIVCK